MKIIDNTLTIVLNGDWNKVFIQPDWIATNIFEKKQIDIGVEMKYEGFDVSYRCDGVVITATQDKIVITALDNAKNTINYMVSCANNYILKAKTPLLSAYGLNIDHTESENTILSDLFDNISDASNLLELDYEIINTQLTRTLKKDDKTINITYAQNRAETLIHYNEHHSKPNIEELAFTYELLVNFINRTKEISKSLGYEFEENTNE